jgi:hypothetical protein
MPTDWTSAELTKRSVPPINDTLEFLRDGNSTMWLKNSDFIFESRFSDTVPDAMFCVETIFDGDRCRPLHGKGLPLSLNDHHITLAF